MVKQKIKEIPEGIKILAFVYFIGALILILIGFFMVSLGDSIRINPLISTELQQIGASISPVVLIVSGFAMIALAVLSYFIGKGLLEAQNWTRILLSVLAILGIISAISNIISSMIFSSIISIAINSTIAWYLIINEKTKEFFK